MSWILTVVCLVASLLWAAPASAGPEPGGEGPITMVVDPGRTKPSSVALTPFGDKLTRPVAAVVDSAGFQADFVENELILSTADPASLSAFLERWGGEVLGRAELKNSATVHYLIRIDTRRADPARLSDDLAQLNKDRPKAEAFAVSSVEGLGLLATVARAAADGLTIGVNWLSDPGDIAGGFTAEAANGPIGFANDPTAPYNRNAYMWSYLNSGSVQNIGLDGAWTLMSAVGRLDSKVRIAILDEGYAPSMNGDLPPADVFTVVDNASPFQPGRPGHSWHGTDVASAAFARPDNFTGGVGPAGPIADPVLVHIELDMFAIMRGIVAAAGAGADIINMSFSRRTHWALGFTQLPLQQITLFVRQVENVLLFSAAGNEGTNVDDTVCLLACWEEALYSPCELAGVACVGGLARNSLGRDPSSNFGSESVDIFGPFRVLVGATPTHPAHNEAREFAGTSASSPFVAGVAALIWAANPDLSADAVQGILMNNRRDSPDSQVGHKVVHAFGAILDAMPVSIAIQTPFEGAMLSASIPSQFRANVFADGHGAATVRWRLENGALLGTGATINALPPPGAHTVTATVTFPDGATASDVVHVSVTNQPPVVHVTGPRNADGSIPVFAQNEAILFRATSLDDSGPLPENRVSWHLDGATAAFATGHNPTVALGATVGEHTVTARGCDNLNICASESVTISLRPAGANQPPVARIVSPANASLIGVTGSDVNGFFAEVTLLGTATDPDGDPLTIVWLDNGSQLATGLNPTVRLRGGCSQVPHRLTLVVSDTAGHVRQDTADVKVEFIC